MRSVSRAARPPKTCSDTTPTCCSVIIHCTVQYGHCRGNNDDSRLHTHIHTNTHSVLCLPLINGISFSYHSTLLDTDNLQACLLQQQHEAPLSPMITVQGVSPPWSLCKMRVTLTTGVWIRPGKPPLIDVQEKLAFLTLIRTFPPLHRDLIGNLYIKIFHYCLYLKWNLLKQFISWYLWIFSIL